VVRPVGGDITNRADVAGVRDSQAHIEALIAREKARGVDARRISLAGFSQGGVIALYTGVRHSERLAGIVALSTYVVLAGSARRRGECGQSRRADLHGARNVGSNGPTRMGRGRAARLVAAGYSVEWHTYPMPHSVVLEEIEAVRAFIARVLA
jgi:phospholipase/carboxylesterase